MSELERIKRRAERSLCIVIGYHHETPLDWIAVNKGLENRVAFVLDTSRSDEPEMVFDVELFCNLMKGIPSLLQSDALTILIEDYGDEYDSLDSFEQKMLSLPEDERHIPRRIRYSHGNETLCCIAGESWADCGGPWPYHDTYTASVYTKEDFSEQLVVLCDEVCNRLGATIWRIFEESPTPVPEKNLRTRVQSFIKGLFKKNR